MSSHSNTPTMVESSSDHDSDHDREAQRLSVDSISANERIRTMISAEHEVQGKRDYTALAEASSSFQSSTWRERVAQWCYDVIDHLNLPRDVVFVAMNILDRYIAVNDGDILDKKAYEVTAITALYLAIRVSGSINIKVDDLLCISRSSAQLKEVNSTGSRILSSLTFSNECLTPSAFVKAFMGLLTRSLPTQKSLSLFELASYLVEIAVYEQQLCRKRPQEIAFAALFVAMSEESDNIDRKTLNMFLHQVEQETGLRHDSARIISVCCRLRDAYKQSAEISNSSVPNVVLDDDEEESSRKRSIEICGSEAKIDNFDDVRPAAHIEDRPCKRVKALY